MQTDACLFAAVEQVASVELVNCIGIGLTNKAAPATEAAHHPTIVRIPTARSLTTDYS